jgi:hypothetical protein
MPSFDPQYKGNVGKALVQKGSKVQLLSGTAKSAGRTLAVTGPPIELMRKMIRTFLIGMLCGVMITAAVTFVFAIPANSDHWRMEIWKRGGAAWTFDKNGHLSWTWTVEPIPEMPRQKRVIVPSSQANIRREQL